MAYKRKYTVDYERGVVKRARYNKPVPMYRTVRSRMPTTAAGIRTLVRRTIFDEKQKNPAQVNLGVQESVIYTLNLTGNIPIGAAETSRAGDCININKVKIKMMFGNFGTNNAQILSGRVFRAILFKSNKQFAAATDTPTASGFGYGDLFYTNPSNVSVALTDPDKITVLADKMVHLNPLIYDQGTSLASINWRSLDIVYTNNAGMKMQYDGPTSNYGKNTNLYLCLMGSIPFEDTTKFIGGVVFTSVLNFIDAK